MTATLTLCPDCARLDYGVCSDECLEARLLRTAARAIRIDAVNGSTRFLASVSAWLLQQASVPINYGHPGNDGDMPPRITGPDPHALIIARAYLDEEA